MRLDAFDLTVPATWHGLPPFARTRGPGREAFSSQTSPHVTGVFGPCAMSRNQTKKVELPHRLTGGGHCRLEASGPRDRALRVTLTLTPKTGRIVVCARDSPHLDPCATMTEPAFDPAAADATVRLMRCMHADCTTLTRRRLCDRHRPVAPPAERLLDQRLVPGEARVPGGSIRVWRAER